MMCNDQLKSTHLASSSSSEGWWFTQLMKQWHAFILFNHHRYIHPHEPNQSDIHSPCMWIDKFPFTFFLCLTMNITIHFISIILFRSRISVTLTMTWAALGNIYSSLGCVRRSARQRMMNEKCTTCCLSLSFSIQ